MVTPEPRRTLADQMVMRAMKAAGEETPPLATRKNSITRIPQGGINKRVLHSGSKAQDKGELRGLSCF